MVGSGLSASLFRSMLGLVSAAAITSSALAQFVDYPYPTASTGSAQARDGFDDRAYAVIALNACGREADYAQLVGELKAGNQENWGEDLTEILIAKAAYPIDPAKPCVGSVARNQLSSISDCDQVIKNEADQPFVQLLMSRDCMARQINDAVLAMQKTKVLGSSDLRCVGSFRFGKSAGEFDVNVRELVRLLYFAGRGPGGANLLSDDAVDHMYKELLATRGPPSDGSYSQIFGCTEPAGDELGSPEDTADRYAWYKELGQDISDLFDWWVRISVMVAAGPPGSASRPSYWLPASTQPT